MSALSGGLPRSWLTADERAVATTRSLGWTAAVFLFDYVVYLAFVAAALLPLPSAASVALGVLAGIFIGNVFTLGHEGAHQALVGSKALNHWIARFAFLPSMHSLSLWIPGHNHIHHTFTNLRGVDYAWEPKSPEDYRVAPAWERALYRLYRSPFGSLPYYLIEIWVKRSVLPLRNKERAAWREHAFDSAFVLLGNALLIASIVAVSSWLAPGRPPWRAVLFAWVIPFLAWNWMMGWVIFMHHTHPEIGWYETREEWSFYRGQVLGTVQADLPPVMDTLANQVMKHHAHHAAPTIPFYRLGRAQARLRAAYPETKKLSITPLVYWRHTRACKLFDYRLRRWTDFDGNPTGPVIPLDGYVSRSA